jgi:hypothetical protein
VRLGPNRFSVRRSDRICSAAINEILRSAS